MLAWRSLIAAGRHEAGFTLVETLVAMVTGLVVTAALFTILEVAMHQTSRVTDYAQASRQARAVMARIVGELHSACIATGFHPIQSASNEKALYFVNAYSSAAEPASATEREILFNEKHELIERVWNNATGSTYPNFTFNTAATPASEVHLSLKGNRGNGTILQAESGGKALPVFEYEKYGSEVTSTNSKGESVGESALEPLKGASASETAAVLIRFRSLPPDENKERGRPATIETRVTLALGAPRTEARINDKPCE